MDRLRNTCLRAGSAVVLSLGFVVLLGCSGSSGKTATVEGKVTLDGNPVTAGEVSFTVGSSTIIGKIEENGTYRAVGVPEGEAKVAVTDPPSINAPKMDPRVAAKMKDSDMPGMSATSSVKLPSKYGKADTSGLTFTVKGGTNTYDIPLTK